MPILIDGTEIDEVRIDGEVQDEVRIDGTLVHRSEIPIDIFDRGSLEYYIGDTGQSDLPHIAGGSGFDNDNALRCPGDGNPNDATNLSPDNPSYDSSEQIELDNYLEPGEIAEVYFRPETFDGSSQFRWALFTDDYYGSEDHIRLRFTEDYWRLEQGSSAYDGSSDSEDTTGFGTVGNYHRCVMDCSDFPTIECHLWDAETGDFISTIGGEGDGNPSDAGHYAWWNNATEMYVSDYRIIDENDFEPGEDMDV